MTSSMDALAELLMAASSREDRIATLNLKVDRIRFGFNGVDRDAEGVAEVLAVVDRYLALADSDPSQVTNPVGDAIEPMIRGLYEAIDNLEQLAAMRCIAQGRWFTDEGGPDYAPPSAANPQDN